MKRGLALFKMKRRSTGELLVKAVDNHCPHAGGSLASGYIQKGAVVCPFHHYPFSLKTGVCPTKRRLCIRVYPTRIVDGRVQVQV